VDEDVDVDVRKPKGAEIVVMKTGARGRKRARNGAVLLGSLGWGP
jgi:hypothetical protein